MVRGCEKRVVRLQEPGNPYFEEVLFVLRDEEPGGECDIVAEAGRIIEENTRGREKKKKGALSPYLSFLLGAVCAAAVLTPFLLL